MPRQARVPRELAFLPFRASDAISRGLLTRRMLHGPSWRRLLPDVYLHTSEYREADHRMWCAAVALKLPAGAAVGGLSAAYLWGVDLLAPNRFAPVTVVLPPGRGLRPHPRVTGSHGALGADDVTSLSGVPVTAEVRTAFDLGRYLPRTDALVALDALLRRKLLRQTTLAAYLEARARWPGTRQVRALLELTDPRSESPMETRLRLILYDAGLPPPVVQYDIREEAGGRFLGRVDLAYPGWRIAIEYEGDHHRERSQFRRDIARLNALCAAGWLVLRFTADDVLRHPARTAQSISAAIRERRVRATSAATS